MRVVYHEKLELGMNEIQIQKGATPLSAGLSGFEGDNPRLIMWYLCEDSEPKETRKFLVTTTGKPNPEIQMNPSNYNHIETTQMEIDGFPLIVHIFEIFGK